MAIPYSFVDPPDNGQDMSVPLSDPLNLCNNAKHMQRKVLKSSHGNLG